MTVSKISYRKYFKFRKYILFCAILFILFLFIKLKINESKTVSNRIYTEASGKNSRNNKVKTNITLKVSTIYIRYN